MTISVQLCTSSVNLCVTKTSGSLSPKPLRGAHAFSAVKNTFFLYFFLFTSLLSAQENNISQIISTIAEQLAEEENDPGSVELYLEKLSELSEDPVNINSSDESSLSRLFFLTDFQIKAIADYSHSSGRIFSVYEIANIPGFNRETAEMIIPFITLGERAVAEKRDTLFSNTLLTNFTWSSASSDSSAPGSPFRLLSKYRFSTSGLIGGFTMEKDPGERFFSGSPALPDFLSAYLCYTGQGFVRKIITGDYSLRFGEGTCLNTGWSSGLFLTSPGYMTSRNDIRPYTSTGENNFLRGVAASFAIKDFSWTVFYSSSRIDAGLTPGGEIKNLRPSGLHNTNSLLAGKDVLADISYGLNLNYSFKKIRAGLTWTEDRLTPGFAGSDGDPENVYDFSGRRNTLYSIYYNTLINRILLFGEITFNESLKHALVQGASLRLSDRLTVNALYRNYRNGYFSFHGKGPGSSNWNERSILANFTFEAAKHLFISAGCDLRYFPWLKYRSSSPSYGIKQEIRIKYLPAENISLEAVYNHRLSMADEAESVGASRQEEMVSDYVRGSFRCSLSERLSFTTRMDYKIAGPPDSHGMLLYQDVAATMKKIPLSLWFRYCLFRTNSWDARLYAYENDLLHSFSIPALSGSGSRSYLMVKYEMKDFVELRIKYGVTSAGEGGKEEVRVQVRVWF